MTRTGNAVPVAAHDRVSDVLARDESLVDVFAACAPHFSKLRNRTMRRVMARLVTVEQAARTAKVPVEQLLSDLNTALGFPQSIANVVTPVDASTVPSDDDTITPKRPPLAPTIELDVRDDLRKGQEPFSKILSVVSQLDDGDVLHLRTTFEPVPLFAVLGQRGFVYAAEPHADDDWSVWFWREAGVGATATAMTAVVESAAAPRDLDMPQDDATTTWLDVRGLNPPEPLMRTLAALDTLPAGRVLVQVNSRVPQFLFPLLVERGYACEVDDSRPDRILVRIWSHLSSL